MSDENPSRLKALLRGGLKKILGESGSEEASIRVARDDGEAKHKHRDIAAAVPAQSELESELFRLIKKRKNGEIVELLAHLDPKERRKLNPYLKKLFRKFGDPWDQVKGRTSCLLALLGTSTPNEVSRRKGFADLASPWGWTGLGKRDSRHYDLVLDLLERVNPELAKPLAELVLSSSEHDLFFLFEAEKRGLISFPTSEEFYLQLVRSAPQLSVAGDWKALREGKGSLEVLFARYPGLLEPAMDSIFDALGAEEVLSAWVLSPVHPGVGGAAQDNPNLHWLRFLVTCVQDGRLGPAIKYFEKSLVGLGRSSKADLPKWYQGCHERLLDLLREDGREQEAVEIEVGYLPNLLSGDSKTVRSFALKRIRELSKHGEAPSDALLETFGQVLGTLPKTGAKSVIVQLRQVARKEPERRERALRLALEGLLHPDTDVHEAVLKLLENHREELPADFEEGLAAYGETIAPSLRPRFEALGASFFDVEALVPGEVEADFAPQRVALEPLRDPDEIIELASFLLQGESCPAEDFERLSAALVRTAHLEVPDVASRTAGLQQLLKDGSADWGSWDFSPVRRALGPAVEGWIGAVADRPGGILERLLKGLGAGLKEFARRHEGVTVVLHHYHADLLRAVSERSGREWLAEPNFSGGWIEPLALVERLRVAEEKAVDVGVMELSIALLRLLPEGRAEALAQAADLSSEAAVALRYALGSDRPPEHEQWWLAAARSRWTTGALDPSPARTNLFGPAGWRGHEVYWGTTDKIVRERKMGSGKWAYTYKEIQSARALCRTEPPVGDLVRGEVPPALYRNWIIKRHSWGADDYGDPSLIAWTATVWPQNSEAFLGWALHYLNASQDWGSAQYVQNPQCAFLGALAGWQHGPLGYVVQWMGLSAEGKAARAAASDALIANLPLPWFRAGEFGAAGRALLDNEILKLNRVLPHLRETASISAAHRRVLRDSLLGVFADPLAAAPRQLAGLLEQLHELVLEQPPSKTPPLEGLHALTGKGKAAVLARKICKALAAEDR